jgi:hypothetical protein
VDQSTVKPIDIMGGESFNPASGAVCAPLRIWADRGEIAGYGPLSLEQGELCMIENVWGTSY